MAQGNAQGASLKDPQHHFPSWPDGGNPQPQNVPGDHQSAPSFDSAGDTENILPSGGGYGGFALGPGRPD